jgi:hypothetical protein
MLCIRAMTAPDDQLPMHLLDRTLVGRIVSAWAPAEIERTADTEGPDADHNLSFTAGNARLSCRT